MIFAKPAGDSPEAFLPLVTLSAPSLPDDEYDAQFYSAAYPGGIYNLAGATVEIVIDLEPGSWIVAEGFQNPQAPGQFEVSGELPANLPEPASNATITMADFSIEVSEGQLVAGTQVIKVENAGIEPHHLYVGRSTVPLTDADLETIAINPDEHLSHVVSIQTISAGNAVWLPITLSRGPHVLFCYFPAIEDGAPHFAHGMHLVTEVPE